MVALARVHLLLPIGELGSGEVTPVFCGERFTLQDFPNFVKQDPILIRYRVSALLLNEDGACLVDGSDVAAVSNCVDRLDRLQAGPVVSVLIEVLVSETERTGAFLKGVLLFHRI